MANAKADAIKTLYSGWHAAMAANPEMSLEEMRALFDHWGDVTAEPGGVDYTETEAGGIPALWAVPKRCVRDRVLLCLHGGGYIVGSMHSHRKLFAHLAKAVGCRALILHYRRAPEHPHPAPVEDVATAHTWLLDQGMRPEHIAWAGDSAGGALVVTGLLKLRDLHRPMPAAGLAMSPWVDMEVTGATIDAHDHCDFLVKRGVAESMSTIFLGENGSRRDPLANPLHADLAGLPPLFIQVGGDETLLDDSRRLAERARQAGVEVTLEVHPAMQHVFQFLAGTAPEADAAIGTLARWVRPRLALG